ncbi:MAG: Spy/CpxP family protein refolding chaperone [Bryobacteraceae bacterium]
MKRFVLALTALTALTGAGLAAQTTPATPPTGSQTGRMHRGLGMNGLAQKLNLTPDQQAQAKAIFQNSRTASAALAPQLKQAHDALLNAVKSGASDAQIDALANAQAPLTAQMEALHAKAFAKLYAILTDDQKKQFDSMPHWMGGGMGARMAR